MSKLIRKRVILAKIETVEGTDAAPVAANAILCSEPRITPLAGGTAARNLARPSLGADPVIPVNSHVQIGFQVEMAGAGAPDTAPAYGPLLRACGLSETVTPTTGPVEYDPVSAGEESATLYFNQDGTLHKLLGCRGNVTLRFPPGDVPRFEFELIGLHVDPTETAAVAPDFTAWRDPLPVSKDNTPTFTLHGYAAVLEELTLNLGNAVEFRDRPGAERVLRTDRSGDGSVSIEAPALTTKDFFAAAKAGTLGTLQIIHGTAAGGIVQIDAPKVQLTDPAYGDSQGVALFQAGLRLNRDAGDDEIKITVK